MISSFYHEDSAGQYLISIDLNMVASPGETGRVGREACWQAAKQCHATPQPRREDVSLVKAQVLLDDQCDKEFKL